MEATNSSSEPILTAVTLLLMVRALRDGRGTAKRA
jgi:hypothetical protein